uniref:Uncharacterized protein n=1 Tax=Panagrolaimus sp. ES5 TaxID=591445 RepID=A0AC34GVE2_9BILA
MYWKYEALIIYLPRILSLYVFLKALMFFTYQEQMFAAINDTDDDTQTSSSSEGEDDDIVEEEICVISP